MPETASRNELIQRVRKLFRAGSYAACLDAGRSALERFPNDADVRYLMGQSLAELQRIDEAGRVFRRLIEDVPGSPRGYLGLAQLHSQRGAWRDCADICASYHASRPPHPQVAALQGQALSKLQCFDEAEAVFRQLMEKTPESPVPYLGLARLTAQTGEWRKCEEICARAADWNPPHPQLTNFHAQALVELRRLPEARSLLSDYFQKTGILDHRMVAGPAVMDRRLAFPSIVELYWKACLGCGDFDTALRFRHEVSNARAQGTAMASLYGGCARYIPFFDNAILGDI